MQKEYDGLNWSEGAYVVDVVVLEEQGQVALALADGRIIWRLIDKPETRVAEITAHNGLTAMRKGFNEGELISIGEDGRVVQSTREAATELAKIDKAWLEHLVLHEKEQLIAAASKKNAIILNAGGKIMAQFSDHPSAVSGLAFDPKGKRLVASHYNGASLWWVNGEAGQKPQRLAWKGSHVGINWAPNGKYILSTMQDNALHGWRVPDFEDFAMSGYAAKPKSMSWDAGARYLATSGAPGIICWDCGGKGPTGRAPIILGEQCRDMTVQVACHPELPLVAAGTIGGLVYAARFEDQALVWLNLKEKSPITALGWSESGTYLCAACENGEAYIWRFLE